MPVQLSFGTAGIRAPLGEADDQLNLRTVRVIAHALVEYALEQIPGAADQGLCLAFDGRTHSEAFAHEVAAVALARGFVVRMFDAPSPTPVLAFCTRLHGAALGVVITASHNPASDNGVKVYWRGGAQILAPHDRKIARRIHAADVAPESVARASLPEARAHGRLLSLGAGERQAYLAAIEGLLGPRGGAPLPRLAYTALCGVGAEVTRALLARAGVSDVVEVAEQALPRSDFGGLASPNPEHPAALAKLLDLADRDAAAVAFAHDPDADRLAVAARDAQGRLRVLSGDEVGALIGDFLIGREPEPTRRLIVSTLVSSDLLGAIARAAGVRYTQTLTGFKWIAAAARALEQTEGLHYLFGYEEAIGYAFGALGDDKDGIAALSVLIELVRELHARGATLHDRLEALARSHGHYATRQLTLTLPGSAGKERLAAIMRELRAIAPERLLGPGAMRDDYLARPEAADLLVFRHPDQSRLCVRPSGTEPKLKFYLQARTEVDRSEPLASAETRAAQLLDAREAQLRVLTG